MMKKTARSKNFHLISPQEQLRFDFFKSHINNTSTTAYQQTNMNVNLNLINYLPFNKSENSFKFLKDST
jgi:hypothetical protein